MRITKQNLHPFFATKILFIRFLDTLFAYIISADIIIIRLNIFL